MIGLYWNCTGVGKNGMATCILDLIRDFSLDFIGLMETKKKEYKSCLFRKIDPSSSL